MVDEAGYPAGLTAAPVPSKYKETSFFFNFEQEVYRNSGGGVLHLFVNLLRADDDIRAVIEVASVGGYFNGIFPGRPNDRLGLALGRNGVSGNLTDAEVRYNEAVLAGDFLTGVATVGVQHHEYPIELNYNIALTHAIEIMPNIQYVRNPNGLNVDAAVVFGLQLSLNL